MSRAIKIHDTFEVKGRGTVICWNLKENDFPQDSTANFFNGMKIEIDGLEYIISGAEKFVPESETDSNNLNWAGIITLKN